MNNIKIVNDLVNTQSITSQTRVSKHWLKITKEKEIRIIEYLNKILSCEKFEIEQDFLNNKDSLHEFMIRFTPYYDNAIEMVGIVNDKNSYKRYINQFENEENYILTSFVNFIIDISQLSNTPKQIEQKAEFDLYSIIDLVLSIT